jgi:outer membrane protein assembly factor BamD (BamD/ComL family)
MRLYLAIDYQDLYRLHRDAHDAARAERFYLRARTEFQRIIKRYPGTEQADAARQQLQKLDEERRQPRTG